MAPGTKLAIGGVMGIGVTIYMAYLGAASSWQYYVTPDECVRDASKYAGSRVRVSGKVAAGSLVITPGRMQANFSLRGTEGAVAVIYTGPLPDNLTEGTEVVVEGRLDAGPQLRGDKLLTRCASKYEVQDVAGAPPDTFVSDAKRGP